MSIMANMVQVMSLPARILRMPGMTMQLWAQANQHIINSTIVLPGMTNMRGITQKAS